MHRRLRVPSAHNNATRMNGSNDSFLACRTSWRATCAKASGVGAGVAQRAVRVIGPAACYNARAAPSGSLPLPVHPPS